MARVTAEIPAVLLHPEPGGGTTHGRHASPPTDAIRDTAFVWDDSNLRQNNKAGHTSPRSKAKYGAWYVPPGDWEHVYQPGGPDLRKEVHLAIRAGVGPGSRFPQGPEVHLQEAINAQRTAGREDDLKKTLVTAYATRVYKEHLSSHQLPEPSHLAGLATPPDAQITNTAIATKRTRTGHLAGTSPGAGSPPSNSPRAGQSPRNANRSMLHGLPVKNSVVPPRMGNNPMGGAVPQRMSISGTGPIGGPAIRSKGTTSPFVDLDLDEIISAEMRAAVRKTLAMNKLMEDHANTMKTYYAQRRKQQALGAALKQRNLEAKTPTGGTALTAEFLMAASPSQMQTLMSPGTGQQVGALVMAAHHLCTDGSLADVQYQPESPVPQLNLPRHLNQQAAAAAAAGRSVKFSNIRHGQQGILGSPDSNLRDGDDNDIINRDDQNDEAGVENLIWNDHDMELQLHQQRYEDQVNSGPQPFGRFNGLLQSHGHFHAIQYHQNDEVDEDIWDVPLHPGPALHIPPHLQLQLRSPSHTRQSVYVPQGTQHTGIAASTHPPDAERLLPHVPRISIPMPSDGILRSDRSLTTSDVLKHVPSKLIRPPAPASMVHMQLSAQVQAHRHNVAHAYLPPHPQANPAALHVSPPPVTAEDPPQSPPYLGFNPGASATSAASDRSVNSAQGRSAPLALHVLGCMAAKAKGLHHVAPIPAMRGPHHSAPTLRNSQPSLQPLRPAPRHPLSASTTLVSQSCRSPSPVDLLLERGRAAGWLQGGKESQAAHGKSGEGHLWSRQHEQRQQRRRDVSTAPHPQGYTESPAAAEVMGLMNLSLAYLSGDRVPKPGSRPGIPIEAKALRARQALALRQNGTAPCSLGRFAALDCTIPADNSLNSEADHIVARNSGAAIGHHRTQHSHDT